MQLINEVYKSSFKLSDALPTLKVLKLDFLNKWIAITKRSVSWTIA